MLLYSCIYINCSDSFAHNYDTITRTKSKAFCGALLQVNHDIVSRQHSYNSFPVIMGLL